MLAWLAPLVVFGLVVFVHELGHFLAAKAVGVYTPRFSIGFGPALWRRRRGETEYVLAALPLGGYVRMASRDDESTAFLEGGAEEATARGKTHPDFDPEAMMPFGPKPVPQDRWFESKPLWARLLIMVAGVSMNALLALVVSIGLAAHYGRAVVSTRVVGSVRPVGGAPAIDGLAPGDTILAIDGRPVANWNDVQAALGEGGAGTVAIRTDRRTVLIAVGAPASRQALAESVNPFYAPVVERVLDGRPAARAGFAPGDSIIAVNGTAVVTWYDVVDRIKAAPGMPLDVAVARRGAPLHLHVVPDTVPAPAGARPQGMIGVTPAVPTTRQPVDFAAAVGEGWRLTGFAATTVIKSVRGILTRQSSVREVGGASAVARQSVAAARDGFDQLLWLLALISINLAIVNLLPIPILDGGQILLVVTEALKGRPFSERTRSVVMWSGLLFVLLLFAFTTFNDIRNWWSPAN